jgi:hypothetical protein
MAAASFRGDIGLVDTNNLELFPGVTKFLKHFECCSEYHLAAPIGIQCFPANNRPELWSVVGVVQDIVDVPGSQILLKHFKEFLVTIIQRDL